MRRSTKEVADLIAFLESDDEYLNSITRLRNLERIPKLGFKNRIKSSTWISNKRELGEHDGFVKNLHKIISNSSVLRDSDIEAIYDWVVEDLRTFQHRGFPSVSYSFTPGEWIETESGNKVQETLDIDNIRIKTYEDTSKQEAWSAVKIAAYLKKKNAIHRDHKVPVNLKRDRRLYELSKNHTIAEILEITKQDPFFKLGLNTDEIRKAISRYKEKLSSRTDF